MDERTTLLVRTHLDSVSLVDEYQKLQAENERLKRHNDELVRYNGIIDKYNDELEKENAKLKCLALHAMKDLFFEKQNTAFRDGECALSWEDKAKCDKRGCKYLNWRGKYLEAYRKAKKALREGKHA